MKLLKLDLKQIKILKSFSIFRKITNVESKSYLLTKQESNVKDQ